MFLLLKKIGFKIEAESYENSQLFYFFKMSNFMSHYFVKILFCKTNDLMIYLLANFV